jgi:hypothetical protein
MRCHADPSGIPTASPAHQDRWIREEAAMAATAFDTAPNPSRRQLRARSAVAAGRHSECPGILPTVETAVVAAPFQPLDPDILSEAIPAFFIGRNKEGFWVARDAKATTGGLFLCEHSALSFARTSSRPAGCATIYPSHRFELDLDNKGNPLVACLGPLMRLAMLARRRTAALIGGQPARRQRAK